MKIPKSILSKIKKIKSLRSEADDIERDIMQWFEDKGIDTSDNDFADAVGSHILYGEFIEVEEVNDYLERYLRDRESKSR